MAIENQNVEGSKEVISVPEQTQNPEELMQQIAKLQAQLELANKQTSEFSKNEITKVDKNLETLGVGSPEETSVIKEEISDIESQKQVALALGEKQIEEVKNQTEQVNETPTNKYKEYLKANNLKINGDTLSQFIKDTPEISAGLNADEQEKLKFSIRDATIDDYKQQKFEEERVMKENKEQKVEEERRKILSVVEKNFENTQQQVDKMKQILDSYKQDRKNKINAHHYNDAVLMVQSIALVVGGGDYGEGLNFIRNPENFNLINDKVALEHSNTSSEVKMKDGEIKGGMNNLMGEKGYPPEVTALMEKRETLVTEVQKYINEAKEIQEREKFA